jgi:hypothetical protein
MARAKITLSPTERQLVTDAGWILTKNAVIGKVYDLFGGLSDDYTLLLEKHGIPAEDTGPRSPKISKGEQYEGLPWVMLDHPRNFSGSNAFAIRSFFWWGHFCSITWHLAGTYLEKYAGRVQEYLADNPGEWLVCTGEDAWEHHLRNSRPPAEAMIQWNEMSFLRISKKISLDEWDMLPEFFCNSYEEILRMIHLP